MEHNHHHQEPLLFLPAFLEAMKRREEEKKPVEPVDNLGLKKVFAPKGGLPICVAPRLYFGDEWNAASREQIIQFDITHFLNVAKGQCKEHFSGEEIFAYHSVEMYETSENLLDCLQACFQFIETSLARGGTVLVYSKGTKMSGVVVLAYLMYSEKAPLADVFVFLKKRIPWLQVSDKLLFALLQLEEHIFGLSISDQPRQPTQTTEQDHFTEGEQKDLVPSLVTLTLQRHSHTIYQYYLSLLQRSSWKELARMFEWLSHLPSTGQFPPGLHPRGLLQKAIYKHLSSEVMNLIRQFEQRQTTSTNDYVGFVEMVWEFISKYLGIVSQQFGNAAGIKRAVVMSFPSFMSKVDSAGEYVASYANWILCAQNNKKKANSTSRTVEEMEEVLCTLYMLLPSKNTFEHSYANKLANRVLNNQTELRLEHDIIQRFAKLGRTEFAESLSVMIKDVALSQEMMDAFNQQRVEGSSFSFHMKMLSAGSWPRDFTTVGIRDRSERGDISLEQQNWRGIHFAQIAAKCILPVALEQSWQDFCSWYSTQYPGRKVRLAPHLGTAEIVATFGSKKYYLSVSTYMMVVLSNFNNADHINFSDLQFAGNIPTDALRQTLHSLVKANILLKQPVASPILPTDVFSLNSQFTSKTNRIKIQ